VNKRKAKDQMLKQPSKEVAFSDQDIKKLSEFFALLIEVDKKQKQNETQAN